jgi:hypothetical protein
MNPNITLLALACLVFSQTAAAFEVGEFKSGMTRDQLKTTLKSWNFEKSIETADTLTVYDATDNAAARRYLFVFCNDRLVGFDQDVPGTFRNFTTITGNYNAEYGNPIKVQALNNVIASGAQNTLVIYWRKFSDIIGVRYQQMPYNEQLTLTNQISNNCWQAPR